jgi:hypothetical protein
MYDHVWSHSVIALCDDSVITLCDHVWSCMITQRDNSVWWHSVITLYDHVWWHSMITLCDDSMITLCDHVWSCMMTQRDNPEQICLGLARTIRAGHNHIYTVYLAWKLPNVRSYTVCIYIWFWPALEMLHTPPKWEDLMTDSFEVFGLGAQTYWKCINLWSE